MLCYIIDINGEISMILKETIVNTLFEENMRAD